MTRILLVDDEPDILFTASLALRLAGFEVLQERSGRAALARLETERPDAIVLDLRMPELDGWQVLEHLQGDRELRLLPVLVLSAHASGHAEERARSSGAAAYMTKPFDPEDLVREVVRAVRGAA